MIGKRVEPDGNGVLSLGAGDYGRNGKGWFVHPPGLEIRWIEDRKVVEHKDGTITIDGLIVRGEWI